MVGETLRLVICATGVYASFLIWALVQEPLSIHIWPNSQQRFACPHVMALCQSISAVIVGGLYDKSNRLQSKKPPKDASLSDSSKMSTESTLDANQTEQELPKATLANSLRHYCGALAMISLTQSASGPLAQYSLQHVDYLTYMLAKSCKMIPVLLVHLGLYRTPIGWDKIAVALLVTLGVSIFTFGAQKSHTSTNSTWKGYILLLTSLFMDGLTNATQDKMLKPKAKQSTRPLTGTHLMIALNAFMIVWNTSYLLIWDTDQIHMALRMVTLDPDILKYLFAYSMCGSLGQCFIFYTLANYGSLVLITITVSRKMISMLLSIFIFGKHLNYMQCVGIATVFSGIIWEARNKKTTKVKQH